MSQTDIQLGVALDGMESVLSEFAHLKQVLLALNTSNPRAELSRVAAAAKTAAASVEMEMKGAFASLVKSAQDASKNVDSAIQKGVADGVAKAQAEVKKSPLTIATKVDPIKFQDGTTTNIRTTGLSSTELLAKQAEVKAMPGAIDPAAKDAQINHLRDLERFGKENAAAIAKASAEEARARAAATAAAAAALKAEAEAVQINHLRDLERFGKENAAAIALAAKDEVKVRAAFVADAAAALKAESEAAQINHLRDLERFGKENAAAVTKAAAAQRVVDNGLAQDRLRDLERFGKERAAAEARAASDAAKAAAKAAARPDGANLGQAIGATAEEKLRATAAANALRESYSKLAAGSHELHSATRGLASGFGAMWLTWGSVIPLVAGAGLSAGFVQTIKMGAQVQESLIRLRVLGGESEASVAGLNAQMLELARTGPFGPMEIAEAMKTLALAGMTAAEVSSSVRDVLNFSLAGDVGIKVAAESLTSIATAFGVSARGFSYVSDVISKSAAESKSSVEDITASFKTASVIYQQFGVNIEEVGVGLALLANAGVKGTAAGTALRNMFADLSGKTKHARDAMADLGVSAFDPLTGKMRETGKVFRELLVAMQNTKSPEGARKSLQAIFTERGEKGGYAILEALQSKAKETGSTLESMYDELLAKVMNSAGFAAIAAAEIGLSPLNQMKSVAATLQSVLVETFDSLQPYLLETAARMKEVFNSAEFKSAVQGLVTSVAQLIAFVLEHGKAIATVVLAYTGLRAAIGIVSAVGGAVAALTVTLEGAAAASVTLGLATRAATLGNPLLLGLGAALTLVAVGWAAVELWSKKAKTTQEATFTNHGELVKNLHEEADRLDKVNLARERGITLQELELELKGKLALTDGASRVSAAKAQVEASRSALANSAQDVNGPEGREALLRATRRANLTGSSVDVGAAGKELALTRTNKLMADELNLQQVINRVDGEARDLSQAKETVRIKALVGTTAERKRIAEEAAARAKLFGGTSNGPPDTETGSAKAMKVQADNEMAMLVKRYKSQTSVLTSLESDKQRELQASLSATLVTQGQFYAEELKLAEQADRNKLGLSEEFRRDYMASYNKRVRDIDAAYVKAESENSGKEHSADKSKKNFDARDTDLANLNRAMVEVIKESEDLDIKTKAGAATRMKLQQISQAGAYVKMQKQTREFWESEALQQEAAARATATEDLLRFASPEDAARITAAATETERWNTILQGLDKSLKESQKSFDAFLTASDQMGPKTEAQTALEWDQYMALVAQRTERQKVADGVSGKANDKGAAAALKAAKDDRQKMVEGVGDALTTAMFDGGKAGSKKVRDILKAELRKPITVAITALVNTVFDNLFGKAMGGQGGAGGIGGFFDKFLGNAGTGIGSLIRSFGDTAPIFDPLAGLAAYAGIPGFANGINYVPHDMVANIHRGEKIITASRNAAGEDEPKQSIVVHQNFTVGDVASISMVRQAVAGSEKRIQGAMGRSMRYQGALA